MRKNRILTFILYVVFFSFVGGYFFIRFISFKYGDSFISYGVAHARRIVTLVINGTFNSSNYYSNVNDILVIDRDDKNNIRSIDIDTYKSNLFLNDINMRVGNNLNYISKGNVNNLDIDLSTIADVDYDYFKDGFVYSIPFGSLIGSGLLSNLGPNIPVKLIMVGDVVSDIDNSVKEYGINNAMIEVKVNVKVTMLVSILFKTEKISVNVSRVVIMKVIQGNIPEYYFVKGN